MKSTDYKPAKPVATKRKKTGITFPAILTPDTGIHRIRSINAPRYKIWYEVGGRKQYVTLPVGTTIEEARTRRDRLYENLKKQFKARRRTPKATDSERKTYTVSLTPNKYIYRRLPYVVRICGKQIGEARTKYEAEQKRDAWLREHADQVPHINRKGEA